MRYIKKPIDFNSVKLRILKQESPNVIAAKEDVKLYVLTGIALSMGYHLSVENPKKRKIHWVALDDRVVLTSVIARELEIETGLNESTIRQWLNRQLVAGLLEGFVSERPMHHYANAEAAKNLFRMHVKSKKKAQRK